MYVSYSISISYTYAVLITRHEIETYNFIIDLHVANIISVYVYISYVMDSTYVLWFEMFDTISIGRGGSRLRSPRTVIAVATVIPLWRKNMS